MFCPKCGANLPDGASFCATCGNKLEAHAHVAHEASDGSAFSPAASVTGSNLSKGVGASPALRIVAIVLAVIALIFALLPWFESSNTLLGIGGFGNAIGQLGSALTGKSNTIAGFDQSYSVFGFPGLAAALSSYGSASGISPLLIIAFIGWLIGVILIVAGLIVMFATQRHSKVPLITGAIVLAIVGFLWAVFYGSMVSGGYAKGMSTNALICAILCVATAIVAVISKADKPAKA